MQTILTYPYNSPYFPLAHSKSNTTISTITIASFAFPTDTSGILFPDHISSLGMLWVFMITQLHLK
jgi:hypothetical protein